jgi:rRNA maturation endonuclease Nob1
MGFVVGLSATIGHVVIVDEDFGVQDALLRIGLYLIGFVVVSQIAYLFAAAGRPDKK